MGGSADVPVVTAQVCPYEEAEHVGLQSLRSQFPPRSRLPFWPVASLGVHRPRRSSSANLGVLLLDSDTAIGTSR
jgi:hypothetical protein